jgi:hypothetical protein
MAYSSITIDFNNVPNDGDTLEIFESIISLYGMETFKDSRLSSYQVRIPTYVPEDYPEPERYIGWISSNYVTAFNLDYNAGNLFTVTRLSGPIGSGTGTVTITANYPGAVFSISENSNSFPVTINNEPGLPEFSVTDLIFTQASNACSHARLNVTTNHLTDKIISPLSLTGNTFNPLLFDWLRGQTFDLILEDVNGTRITQSVTTPSLLNASNFTLQIINSPNGATVTAIGVNTDGLVLQYSLDNSTWQNSNVFNGLAVGDFSLYVKDQLGCSFNKPFSVDEFGIQTSYFYISKANSFRFANRITFGDSENYKNDENTLSCEVDVQLAYKELQQFQSADIITTQFKSNYGTNVATIIKEDLSEINVPVVKMTNNIGIKDRRDARKYNLGNGKTGVYFLSGNMYNYDTSAINGTYSLNGLLPEWAQIGNYIIIANAWFLIEEIVYDETKNAEVAVFTNNYTGSEVNVVVGSIYNRFNYEVYEFFIDMVDYINEKFRVKLVNSNVNFKTITHLSELIWCKVKHENVLEIRYRNTTNTDIFYSTGIEHKIRIPYLFVKGKSDESSEVHKTDTDAILLSADMYEVDDFQFEPVTKEIWRKLMIALSHEKVAINGVGYIKNGSFNTEGPLERSNLYVLTATMIKTGSVYNSQTSGNLDFDGSEVEVPGLISTESGYMSY